MTAPGATYRLQLGPDFGFADAADLTGYLADLGVSHAYCSPYLQATPGSAHGYDVTDPTSVSAELGGEEGREAFVRALREHGLGHVLDIVPNHMAIRTPDNRWWWDVLENGPFSAMAPVFDIDWKPPEEKLRGQVLLPVLGDHYGRVLEAGELVLEREGAAFRARYHEHVFPLSPWSAGALLAEALHGPGEGERSHARAEAAFLARALRRLPEQATPEGRRERRGDLRVLRARMEAVLACDTDLAERVDAVLERTSRDPDRLEALMDAQHYRISHWRAGSRELDYRRFFDIDGLAGVRVENPEVFASTHARVLAWVTEGSLDGVRVDHPDGLRRPAEYFRRLREAAPRAWIVAEKILEREETLPADWPVDGTTGYEVLNDVGSLFVDAAGEASFSDLHRELTGDDASFREITHRRKLQILDDVLPADLGRVTQRFVEVCEHRRRYRDFTRWALRETLREAAASFPVYRTYVTEEGHASDADRAVVERALAEARGRRPDLDPELFDLLADILLGRTDGAAERDLRMRFQQLTGPVMAKGVEDTAFYAWTRFVALNEVGGDPSRFGIAPADFHERRRWDLERRPRTMTTLSTHDTKRSEDVRARLYLLSEIPGRWRAAVHGWTERSERHRGGPDRPDGGTLHLFWQTLVGAWPLSVERALAYMRKAAREAKTHTSWRQSDEAWEDALETFVRGVLGDPEIMEDVGAFAGTLVRSGRIVSLAQKLVQLTIPGVPDVYRGTELWDLSLVDPDNRRRVDFALRRRLLDELAALDRRRGLGDGPGERGAFEETPAVSADPYHDGPPEGVPAVSDDPDEPGVAKLWVVRQALRLRRRRPGLFGVDGAYTPLEARGSAADHVFGFSRGGAAVTVVPRLVLGLERRGGWGDTTVVLPSPARGAGGGVGGTGARLEAESASARIESPDRQASGAAGKGSATGGPWRNLLTGERWPAGPVPMAKLLDRFPVALLEEA